MSEIVAEVITICENPAGWPTAKLGDVAPSIPLRQVRCDEQDDVLQITLDHIESDTGRLLSHNYRPLCEAGGSTHYFSSDHVLYSKLRPYLNKVYLPIEEGVGTSELVPMLPEKSRLDREYLAYYLRSEHFVNWVSTQTAGAKMPRVSMRVFWEHKIPLPPLPEQRRIAAVLDKADAIRRKRQQAAALADAFLRSVFLDMFGDPVTNPKGWKVRPLKSITSKIGSGATPRGGKEVYTDSGISLIRSLNIHDDNFLHDGLVFIDERQGNALSSVEVQAGDVLLNITGASVCRAAIVDQSVLPARVNQHVCIVRPADICSEYLLCLLISGSYKQLLLNISSKNGATREALTKAQVGELPIPLPPTELQDRFAEIKRGTLGLADLTGLASEKMLFESLSQWAFSGQL